MKRKDIHIIVSARAISRIYAALIVLGSVFLFGTIVEATTPNPGHPWTDIGNGNWQVVNTQTATRSFTFPDSDETVLTTAGAPQSGTIPYGNGTGALATTSAGTPGFVLAYLNAVPTWVATTTLANISGTLGLTGGGTNASLTASNGGIVWSNASQLQILGGTGTAGQALLSGANATPSWTTATFPSTAGAAGQVLMSNGTNWVSAATSTPTDTTVVTVPLNGMATGAIVATTTLAGDLTTRDVGLFNVKQQITVNQIAFSTAAGTAGTAKICVYSEDGNTKVIDVTSSTLAVGNNFVAVSAVVLPPANYYIAIGCATTCTSNTLNMYTTTANALLNTGSPNSKKFLEGRVTHSSGVCNSTLGTIKPMQSATPLVRLDN